MLRNLFSSPVSEIKRVFKTEDSKFILSVALKITSISLAINVVVHWFLFQIMRVNYAFFKAHGFPEFTEGNPFFQSITSEVLENLPVLCLFHVSLFFVGAYVGWLMLRPFRTMGAYCEAALDNMSAVYQVDQFSAYSLLTHFSEFFFEYLREIRKKNVITTNSIPPQYSGIHKPVFDHIFMFHFGLLLVIIAISTTVFTIENSSAVFSSMVELATKTLKDQQNVSRFFSEEMFIINDIVWFTIILVACSYTLLGLHLYAKVSGAAFGIFSTMRSFMKGNYSSRVHLLGFAYVRDETRKLNKYLDYIQNNFSKDLNRK